MIPNLDDDDDIMRRAFRAYFRAGGVAQPASYSGVREHDGRLYAVLENVRGPLAVFSVSSRGGLRSAQTWPEALTN